MKIYMTDAQAEHAFRMMWLRLAKSGGDIGEKEKDPMILTLSRYSRSCEKSIRDTLALCCFACGEAADRSGKDFPKACRECPINWGGQGYFSLPCLRLGTLYNAWGAAKTAYDRRLYAAAIAKLPWKKRGKR